MLKKILSNKQCIIGLLMIILIVFIALFSEPIAPNDPNQIDNYNKFSPPSLQYPLGTDQLGRCQLSRLIVGTSYSVGITFPIIILIAIIGLSIGLLAAYKGGILESFTSGMSNVFMAFPSLVVAISLVSVFGSGTVTIVTAIVIAKWAWSYKMVKACAESESVKNYILSAKFAGESEMSIIFRQIMPNILPQFIVFLSTTIASSILMISSFSFLGISLGITVPEWGNMLNEGRMYFLREPKLILYPGLCLFITASAFNLFGEGMRDVLAKDVR